MGFGNFSLSIYQTEEKEEKEMSLLHNCKPDYIFEIFDIDKQFKSSQDFKKHIDNFGIADFYFYSLNIGDLLISTYNAYLYLNEHIEKIDTIFNEYNRVISDFKADMGLDTIIKKTKHTQEFAREFTFQHCIMRYLDKTIETENKPLFYVLLDLYINKKKPDHLIKIPSVSTVLEISLKDNTTSYYFNSFEDVLIFDFYQLRQKGSIVKKCVNCNKLFIPFSRSDEIYCDNEYKNGKTCKQLGYEIKLNKDEFLKAYRTAYKTQHAKMQRNNHILNYKEKYFNVWVKEAKEKLKQAQNGIITIDEFKHWLKEN